MNSVSRVTNSFKLCFWNLNGVKNKFMSTITDDVIQSSDIVVITETHFNIRTKCPSNFILLDKSPPTESKRPRGGVAIYKKIHCTLQFTTLLKITDCIVCEIKHTNIILIALYIPPSNSPFFNEDCFDNLISLLQYFVGHKVVYVIGDLNSRYGDLNNINPNLRYKPNPDTTLNTNGQKLRNLLEQFHCITMVNGLLYRNKTFNTDFTFYRGNSASQIDVCLTNDVINTDSLKILKKTAVSDHSPVIVTISTKPSFSLEFLETCVSGFLSYRHYDINRKLRKTVKMENCNLLNLVNDLEKLGDDLLIEYGNSVESKQEVEVLNQRITDGIYEACIRNKRKETLTDMIDRGNDNLKNCDSKNFQAIADANASYFQILVEKGDPNAQLHKEKWLEFQELAFKKEKEEMQENNFRQWKHLYSDKPRKMWELIDWKQKDHGEKKELSPDVTAKFFQGIFQAKKIENDPKLYEAQEIVKQYNQICETTDKDISIEEIERARRKMKRGVGMDGISPNIMSIAPKSLMEIIQKLYNTIFGNCYPECWNEQLLLSFAKKDHSSQKPSLRGIGIGPVLSRMFDVVMNMRFGAWYSPNKEQAGFREEQGCLLQILGLLMLIDLSKRLKKDLLIGVIDYEKAFDFTNRFLLCKDMMNNLFGKRFIMNFMNSYESTSYVVKASSNERGESIKTDQGLTQGKTTSSSFFSLYVSDMPAGLSEFENNDFMDPFYLFQLADDTTITAEIICSFIQHMTTVAKYSLEKFLRIHPTKSKYFHLTENNKMTEDIDLGGGITLKPIEDGYNWLGFWLCDTNNISEIINFHIGKKMVHVSSFYSWLAVNEDTPFIVKRLVLYVCLFATLLYSCEVWTNLEELSEKLLMIEKKALKSCLGIKMSTPDDIIYQELNQADIISTIQDRQHNFFTKFIKHDENSAIAMCIWNLYNSMVDAATEGIVHYYQSLQPKNREINKDVRKNRINTCNKTMTARYRDITNLQYCDTLYNCFVVEKNRKVITRWRFSCHSLRIETGRYHRPKIPRNERNCTICNEIEDEHHAIFVCAAHAFIRLRYTNILSTYTTVQSILHPSTIADANTIGKFILEIERNMNDLKMVFKY